MIERVGNVIYWTFTALAGLIVLGLIDSIIRGGAQDIPLMTWALAAVLWLFGRGARYILAGK